MAYTITDACTACDLCVEQCPIGAVAAGDPVYVIDETCCDFAECVVVCPADAIVPLADVLDAARTGGPYGAVRPGEGGAGVP